MQVQEFKYYKRNLPHWELPGSVYFITFKTAKGFSLSELAKDITLASFKFHDGKKYKLHACVIMQTHVHSVLQPLKNSDSQLGNSTLTSFYSIAQITHSVKSFSANKIQKELNKKGNVWLDENYDRIIRDKSEYLEKVNYIINNPVKADWLKNLTIINGYLLKYQRIS